MIIGFTGAHRVGKTTLAQALANRIAYKFKETNITSSANMWVDNHISPADQFSFIERVLIQAKILAYSKTVLDRTPNTIYDRTPMDYLGYLYANVDSTTSNLSNDLVDNFVRDCIYEQCRIFDITIFISPEITVQADPVKKGKTFLSDSYITAVSNNIQASCINYIEPKKFISLPLGIRRLEDRVDWLFEKIFLKTP